MSIIETVDCYQCGGEGWLDVSDPCLACRATGRVTTVDYAAEVERCFSYGWITADRRAALLAALA